MSEQGGPSARLEELIEEFAEVEPRERLEILLEYAENLPPLPPEYEQRRQAGENRVHECQTPVYLWVTIEDGRLRIIADVAPEAPTVKGFVGMLVEALSDQPPQAALNIPANLLSRMGLVEALGMVRMRGLSGIVNRIRNEVRRQLEAA